MWSLELTLVLVTPLLKVLLHGKAFSVIENDFCHINVYKVFLFFFFFSFYNSGATVYMVCRNKERGEEALSKIQNSTGNQNVYLEVCSEYSVLCILEDNNSF